MVFEGSRPWGEERTDYRMWLPTIRAALHPALVEAESEVAERVLDRQPPVENEPILHFLREQDVATQDES